MTTFNASTPPTNYESADIEELPENETDDNLLSASAVQRGNRLAMSDAAQREANLIIGTTHAAAARADLRLSEDRAAAERTRAQIDAQRGGPTITTSLRGDVGKAVSELLDLRKIDAAYSKVAERVRGEVETVEAEKRSEARILGGLLDSALVESRAKRRTPDVLAPLIRWVEHERPDGRPEGYALAVFDALGERQAAERTERVRECAPGIQELLNSSTQRLLDQAVDVADTLETAGLSVDATADEVVDSNDPAVLTAWRAWRGIVSEWTDLQSTRRWIAVAIDTGFDPKRPEKLLSDADAERESWETQFEGVRVEGVEGSHQALTYWLERVRPRP